MSEPAKPAALTPDQHWLEIATKDLTAPAKERIGQEIEAHFAAAVESQMENGVGETEAKMKALEELGNPQTAAKRFRRQHLTNSDTKLISQLLRYQKLHWLLISFIGVPLSCWILFKLMPGIRQPFSSTGLVLMVVYQMTTIARLIFLHYYKNNLAVRKILLLQIADLLGSFFILVAWFYGISRRCRGNNPKSFSRLAALD